MKREIVIAAGGTGGHIIPGILIGREIEERFGDRLAVAYLCGSRAIEERVYTSEGITPIHLSAGGRLMSSSPLIKFARMVRDFLWLASRFARRRPAAVLAMGGAVCFPALAAAVCLRIPIFLHESNRVEGRVVRVFRRFARKVFIGMGEAGGKNVVYTGTPSRLLADSDGKKDILLCVGGSQGAARLNDTFVEAANSEAVRQHGLTPILIAGPGKAPADPGIVEVREYEANLPALIARARLIVSRCGSGALADIAANRTPAILVPYPHAKDNHQLANAAWFTERGGARLVEDKLLTGPLLTESIADLLAEPDALGDMQIALGRLATPMAGEMIANEIFNSIGCGPLRPHTAERRVRHEHP